MNVSDADAHLTSAADSAATILLVRSGPAESCGCAFVLTGHGVYKRILADQAQVDDAIEGEAFDLVLNDARGHMENPFLVVEKFRRRNGAAPFLLLCPSLELDEIVKAIRLGVSDILSPPFDYKALHERAVDLMRMRFNRSSPNITPSRWSEIARFIAELEPSGEEPALVAPSPSAAVDPAQRRYDRGEHDQLGLELGAARAAAAQMAEEQARWETERLAQAEAVRLAEEALAHARCELAEQREAFELTRRAQAALEERHAALTRREAELRTAYARLVARGGETEARPPHEPAAPVPDTVAAALTSLARQASELAASVMSRRHQRPSGEQEAYEAMARSATNALRDRKTMLAEREAAVAEEIRL